MHMKKMLFATGLVAAAIAAGITTLAGQQDPPGMEGMPEMPAPQKEHEWLHQFVGEWTTESEISPPGAPPIKSTGAESVRSLGGRWIISELTGEMPGMGTMTAVMTVGYDPAKGKYIGTWVDSMTDILWIYEGTVDSTGKILTLEAEGPNMIDPTSTKPMKYRDVSEFKSADVRTLTSYFQAPDGSWQKMVSGTARRKK